MAYGETKVYFDGSHYIAIPHTTRDTFRRPSPPEETITVVEEVEGSESEMATEPFISATENTEEIFEDTNEENTDKKKPLKTRNLTRKELFEELYMKHINLRKKARQNRIYEDMKQYFESDKECYEYVLSNFERKERNLICRRIRMTRKANLANFNYFCTFTYDNNLHTEQSFKKKLKICLMNMCKRKGWKYMGVWERAPKTNRLHFHGLFHIPDDAMPMGGLLVMKDFDTRSHKMRETVQSVYFNERFGRSDFEKIDPIEMRLGNALAYLMKYLEKTNDKIVYSKGLPQYFISDIMEDDVVCTMGQEDTKLLLFDDFNCWDEGCLVGKVCPEVIDQMRKCN